MTDKTPVRPTGVRLLLPTGDTITLDLELGPCDPDGNQLWMAYGPSGVEIPFGSRIEFDDMPPGTGLGVALEREGGMFGRVVFADRSIFQQVADGEADLFIEQGEPDGRLDDVGHDLHDLPEWGKGWTG